MDPDPRPRRPPQQQRVAVIGAGWAGLAAAVRATHLGHAVTLYEMAPQAGGRARSLPADAEGRRFDNGQHILIGAYHATLDLMRQVGVDPETALLRLPLCLLDQNGRGLRMPPGPPVPAFVRAVWAMHHWRWRDRLALQVAATGWMVRGFRCDPAWTVARLTHDLPPAVRAELIDPLCVAALNTPASEASAQVFLRVLKDALFSGPGSSDLLIPKRPLAELLPEPAWQWLGQQGASCHLNHRVHAIDPEGRVDGVPFDRIVLACSAVEAARLTADIHPSWSAIARQFRYEPIITGYLKVASAPLPAPMLALQEGPDAPAQFAFDHGQLGGTAGLLALVVSGAAPWMAQGTPATRDALVRQVRDLLAPPLNADSALPQMLLQVCEKRATFRCTPGLARPEAFVSERIRAAGDHVQGPYPATLEGAVRSGQAAVDDLP